MLRLGAVIWIYLLWMADVDDLGDAFVQLILPSAILLSYIVGLRGKRAVYFSTFMCVILSVGSIIVVELHQKGYCISEGGILSDEDKKRLAVEKVLRLNSSPATRDLYKYSRDIFEKSAGGMGLTFDESLFQEEQKRYNVTPYKSVEEFLGENPDCCWFTQQPFDGYSQRNFRWKRPFEENIEFFLLPTPGTEVHVVEEKPTFGTWLKGWDMERVRVRFRERLVDDTGVAYVIPTWKDVMVTDCGMTYGN